jgi:hypothetical protein
MNISTPQFGTVIIGGGPAGTAVLLAACHSGRIKALLDQGVAIIEASDQIGPGEIGGHAINSDSTGATFVDCIQHGPGTIFDALRADPLTLQLLAAADRAVPLVLAGAFMRRVGAILHQLVAAHPGCAVLTGTQALSARRVNGGWQTRIRRADGQTSLLASKNLVLATGARQPRERLGSEQIAGAPLLAGCAERLMQSGEILRVGGVEQAAARLRAIPAPKIAVIGGSTSAVSVVQALLTRLPQNLLSPGAITLLHRRSLKIYFPTVAEARAEGYTDFDENDLCPLTQRIYRFAGLRFDQREVIMRALAIGGRAPDPRLVLHRLQSADPVGRDIIASADLVIAALGYRPNALPLADAHGTPIRLFAQSNPQAPLVDDKCRVLDATRTPVANLFGIGLAAGFVPRGALGGEPSFSGQANGLWLWQTAVGGLIVDALLAAPAITRPQPARPRQAPRTARPDQPLAISLGAAE